MTATKMTSMFSGAGGGLCNLRTDGSQVRVGCAGELLRRFSLPQVPGSVAATPNSGLALVDFRAQFSGRMRSWLYGERFLKREPPQQRWRVTKTVGLAFSRPLGRVDSFPGHGWKDQLSM
ncbi:MAG: hypothetical protein H7A53_08115 [Akkermansiaceae bacterium]|nr:hypothetical protein [Akkermansiaceae bacterium]